VLLKNDVSKTTNMISCNTDIVIWELQRAESLCPGKQRNRNSNPEILVHCQNDPQSLAI